MIMMMELENNNGALQSRSIMKKGLLCQLLFNYKLLSVKIPLQHLYRVTMNKHRTSLSIVRCQFGIQTKLTLVCNTTRNISLSVTCFGISYFRCYNAPCSLTQPFDQRIIKSFKTIYKSDMGQRIIQSIDQ